MLFKFETVMYLIFHLLSFLENSKNVDIPQCEGEGLNKDKMTKVIIEC